MSNLPPADADRLADYRFQFGPDAGNLALALDLLTDVVRIAGQHAVYCRVAKGERAGEPPLDVAELLRIVHAVKGLVQECHIRLKTDTAG